MQLTTAAKSRFEMDDLLERGRALIEESIGFGVTHMRAFVEVDPGVGMKCLEAGLLLKDEFEDRCFVQICVFAQDPIFTCPDGGEAMRALLEEAAMRPGVDAIGSTPYVETIRDYHQLNFFFTTNLAKKYKLHLDFHIDYNLDPKQRSVVLEVIQYLHARGWPSSPNSPDYRTIVFGHCTRLTLFDTNEWLDLREKVRGLPISFVGLPTSDLFMMGRPNEGSGGGERPRGTLQVPQMIEKYGFNAAIGINNVGNAFTPQGSCDPLRLASFGVGIYQAGTKKDAEVLLECVSSRAKTAIGVRSFPLEEGSPGDFVVFHTGNESFRSRKSVQELLYDPPHDRTTIFNGRVVSQ
ncbi:Cytosine deaminase [Lachnellula suecica]|uniref:Cytosine deaminase n=1 Tax=Lachnellula suecica TaxID=602035 RepID=A0A8T9C435_9HELO|nr:Cytosine deaminase [Lachnellula suecica]